MEKAILLTHNDLELECLILFKKPLIGGKEEVLAYAQNRLVKGLLDNGYVAEFEIISDFCICPDLNEQLYEQ